MGKKLKHTNHSGETLFAELSQLIQQSQTQVAVAVNSTLTTLFWQVGHRINTHILQNRRAEYGKQIVPTVSAQLEKEYGRNFTEKNVRRMMKFAVQFQENEIVVTLSRQLSWSHFVELLPLKKGEARLFYAQKSVLDNWGVRELRDAIARKEFERNKIALPQLHPDLLPEQAPVFKDPYFLDFLGLQDDYLEKDLEAAILKELERFILEIGKGFAFVERQKRMIIDGEDYHLDLLFYHRKLKRLVAIDLKIGKFQAKDKGQMELYLKWLDKYERQEGEEKPVGLMEAREMLERKKLM
ncbi:MAG: PDDEXK nuclease domain-containing protein [Bacteroidota bacterium]|nr:PDDEXK nuclease domain-containing protein [Bacteroidota bacterium]